ncbi:hypothetical protein J121_1450 [Qipengyuania citrea LAMA 915]|jgi:uncharacterized membrane protein YoaK (UPF0700 family)|uniref:Uncharacterized protein n=1 Tax=Qipengyuania citrea LAMA 915 TaxID=1306953 RepID=A0A0L1KA71_9SPHN|nr:hypothetical protein [Qipengyuania citrea]KNH00826.1 hypothetical protein J121_1450 [Qipengyuania citrea LAMA 915]
MSLKPALLFASAIIAIAVLAIFDVIPEQLARFSVILLPALAAIHIARRGSCGCSAKFGA